MRGFIVAALAILIAPAVTHAGMAGTKHDLSAGSSAAVKSNSQTELCIFCHVPHNSQPTVGRPLWNHAMTNQTLTWNPGSTVRGTTLPGDITSAALNGSRACMSCHDGTIALGDLVSGSGGTVSGPNVGPTGKLTGGVNFINPASMETTHPLGVQKPAAVTGFTGFKNVPVGNAINYDADGYVQCGSCHNPHDNTHPPFLKADNTGSAICVTCHDL